MSFNFPSNPSSGATYVYNGKIWIFNGSAWTTTPTTQGIAAITSNSQPATTIDGTEWFDTSSNSLKVYYQGTWYPSGGVLSSATQPSIATPGQLWYDTVSKQLKLYNGTTWIGMLGNDTMLAYNFAF